MFKSNIGGQANQPLMRITGKLFNKNVAVIGIVLELKQRKKLKIAKKALRQNQVKQKDFFVTNSDIANPQKIT